MVSQATEILKTSNQTLQDVNEKLHSLSPLFYIANDIGEASHKLASTLTDASKTFQENTAETKQVIQRENLEGLYGGAALGYFLWKKIGRASCSESTWIENMPDILDER